MTNNKFLAFTPQKCILDRYRINCIYSVKIVGWIKCIVYNSIVIALCCTICNFKPSCKIQLRLHTNIYSKDKKISTTWNLLYHLSHQTYCRGLFRYAYNRITEHTRIAPSCTAHFKVQNDTNNKRQFNIYKHIMTLIHILWLKWLPVFHIYFMLLPRLHKITA